MSFSLSNWEMSLSFFGFSDCIIGLALVIKASLESSSVWVAVSQPAPVQTECFPYPPPPQKKRLNHMESFRPFVFPFCEGEKRFLFIDLHKGVCKQLNTVAVCLAETCFSNVRIADLCWAIYKTRKTKERVEISLMSYCVYLWRY